MVIRRSAGKRRAWTLERALANAGAHRRFGVSLGPRCGAHGRVRTHREVGVAARVSEPPRRRHAGGYFPSYLAPQGPARRRVPRRLVPDRPAQRMATGRPWRGAQPAASAWLEGWLQRRQPEKSGVRKLIEDVRGALPGAATGAPRPVSLPAGRSEAARSVASPLLTVAPGSRSDRDKIALKLSRDHLDEPRPARRPARLSAPEPESV